MMGSGGGGYYQYIRCNCYLNRLDGTVHHPVCIVCFLVTENLLKQSRAVYKVYISECFNLKFQEEVFKI